MNWKIAGLILGMFCLLPQAQAGLAEGIAACEQYEGVRAQAELQPLARQGHAEAQYWLGRVFYYPEMGVQDYRVSAGWFLQAARQGHAAAQYKLGGMYFMGRGVPQDDRQAVRWWLAAARQGHDEALNNLGALFATGRGVPHNLKVAYALQSMAQALGHAGAAENLRLKEDFLGAQDRDEARSLARAWALPDALRAGLQPFLGAALGDDD